MFSISPYKLNLYLECPRHYWWNYINPSTRSKYPPRPYFTMGDHVHNTLKLFFNLPQEKRTKKAMMWLLDQHWLKKNGTDGGFWNQRQEEEYKERAHLMLSAFFDREDMTIEPLWASDKLIKTDVSESLTFMGKIDRVDVETDGLHIIDYKTSKEEREDEWQLPMYSVMAKAFFDKPVIKLSYMFLETGSLISVPANPARDMWTVSRIEQIVKSMPHSANKNDWICADGDGCQHCNYLKELGIDPLGEIVTLPLTTPGLTTHIPLPQTDLAS